MVKNPLANVGNPRDVVSIPGLGRSPGVGNGNHYSILDWEIPWPEKPGGLFSPWGCKELNVTKVHACTRTHAHTV